MTFVRRLLVVALALVLAACGGLPNTSGVQRGLEVQAPEYQPIRLQFEPPTPGASPAQIVQGFLAAGGSPDDDYAASRAYLTSAASSSWQPRSGVTVYTDSRKLTVQVSGDTVSLNVPLAARVDDTGRYLAASPGAVTAATIGLTKVQGEWRISRLPEGFGTWLSSFYFERSFRQMTITYADPRDRTLVTDYRWFPLRPDAVTSRTWTGLATSLARAQLAPVPDYLEGAAVTAFPPGTDLAVESVPIIDQIAHVELTSSALEATTDGRRAAWAQMLSTLRQVPGVSGVSITVDGAPLKILGVDGAPTSLGQLGYDAGSTAAPALVIRDGEQLQAVDFTGWLRGGENQRAVDVPLPKVPKKWESLAISPDMREVTAVGRDRVSVHRWTKSGAGQPKPFGSSLTQPSMDKRGRTWVGGVDTRGRPRIWWFGSGSTPTSAPTALTAAWLKGSITEVRASPGSRRLAVSLTDASGTSSVYVAGIVLGQDGAPIALGSPWRIATGLSTMRDLAWADDGSLAAVASWEGSDLRPVMLPLGAPVELLPPVQDVDEIITSGGVRGVIVLTADRGVWRRVDGTWQQHATADDLIVPGS
ncbi:GerMN domain-containing protein [Mobilicoccus sp.]|uniref:GerMN domain-containing protein n=1 Tax=Mobilicoccus sp. TaxID=2034349 RepID=UPI002899F678|nr:GerMN domain-containing protein [Mobilicoccus sp.]